MIIILFLTVFQNLIIFSNDCLSGTSGILWLLVIGWLPVIGTVVHSLRYISSSDGQNPLCNGVDLYVNKANHSPSSIIISVFPLLFQLLCCFEDNMNMDRWLYVWTDMPEQTQPKLQQKIGTIVRNYHFWNPMSSKNAHCVIDHLLCSSSVQPCNLNEPWVVVHNKYIQCLVLLKKICPTFWHGSSGNVDAIIGSDLCTFVL